SPLTPSPCSPAGRGGSSPSPWKGEGRVRVESRLTSTLATAAVGMRDELALTSSFWLTPTSSCWLLSHKRQQAKTRRRRHRAQGGHRLLVGGAEVRGTGG